MSQFFFVFEFWGGLLLLFAFLPYRSFHFYCNKTYQSFFLYDFCLGLMPRKPCSTPRLEVV